MTKAFDSLDRNILYSKLLVYGIGGTELAWFRSYSSSRQQYVVYKNSQSERKSVEYVVPQGSIVGPLLFLIYVNDIVYASHQLKCTMFADDTNVFFSSNNIASLYIVFNAELRNISKWFVANKLTLNVGKTTYIYFIDSRDVCRVLDETLKLVTAKLKKVTSAKFLGITLHATLQFKDHVAQVLCRLARFVALFYKIRDLLNTQNLHLLYNSLVLPNMMYCHSVWGACNNTPL